MRIAVVGSGISGLTCTHLLAPLHDVTLFEADDRLGGHTNTVDVVTGEEAVSVDTGFIVYNERNYPGLVRLFDRLGVPTKPSEMSFSVSDDTTGIEWRGTSVGSVFAQRRNLVRPWFLRGLADVVRFNRVAHHIAEATPVGAPTMTLGDLVESERLSSQFVEWYLVPLASSIWSAPPGEVLGFDAGMVACFFQNHGMLGRGDQLAWRTVDGGARRYVQAIAAPLGRQVRRSTPVRKITRREGHVEIVTDRYGSETFDHVIVATHSDQALELLSDPTAAERSVLGAIGYQANTATLHTDAALLPRSPRARASWNFHRSADPTQVATLTYDLNRLQSINSERRYCVTINCTESIDPTTVLATIDYAHPVLDAGARAAQARHGEVSDRNGTSYCGAYWGYGFHEDGLQSAVRVCEPFGARL